MNRHSRTALTVLAALLLGAPAHAVTADAARGAIVDRYLRQPTGTVPLSEATGQVREFTLEIHEITGEIAPGVRVKQWAFAHPGQAPSVPGPEIRVRQGDLVRITLRNTSDQPHTIHPHGINSVAEQMDGLREVLPGQSFTYEFVATEAGTFAYHCHFQTNLHLDMGMYGALIVEPADEKRKVWTTETTLILDEWDTRQDPEAAVHRPQPNYFLVNGRAHPLIPNVIVKPGEVGLLRLINLGIEVHSMHLHGQAFLVIAKDGHDLPVPYQADTVLIAPGERYDLLVRGRDGTFPFHDHSAPRSTNDGAYPGGMHMMLQGSPALDAHGKPEAPGAAGHGHGHHAPAPVAKAAPATPVQDTASPPAPHAHQHGPAAPAAQPAPAPAPEPVDVSALPLLTDADDPTITVAGFKYDHPVLRVKAGTTVTWVNRDFVAHAITLQPPGGGPTVLKPLARLGRTTITFTEPGVYDYLCQPHPFMRGRVVVE